jgi:amidase
MKDIQPWEALAHRKQAEAADKIPPAWRVPAELLAGLNVSEDNPGVCVLDVPRRSGLMSAGQLDITEIYDATALLAKMHAGELTSFEVTEAFCIRAAIAQQVVRLPRPTFEVTGAILTKHDSVAV